MVYHMGWASGYQPRQRQHGRRTREYRAWSWYRVSGERRWISQIKRALPFNQIPSPFLTPAAPLAVIPVPPKGGASPVYAAAPVPAAGAPRSRPLFDACAHAWIVAHSTFISASCLCKPINRSASDGTGFGCFQDGHAASNHWLQAGSVDDKKGWERVESSLDSLPKVL